MKTILFAVFALNLFVASSFAAKEALLIANADYSYLGDLPNPTSDARQLANVLRQIGFNVSILENAGREDMLLALEDFEERLRASRGIAFFHYGGHGVQVDGKNFLVPADANIPDEKRVATRAVDVDEVMAALDSSGAAANVVVLDACRDNPLPSVSTRSAARGLSVVARKPKNSIIIYAAEADNRALDGLFTPVLSQAIAASGNRDISEVMKQVRKEVFQRSDGAQTPGEYNQLFDPLILADGSILPPSQPFAAPTPPQASGVELPSEVSTPIAPQQSADPVAGLREFLQAFIASLASNNPSDAAAFYADVSRSCYARSPSGSWSRSELAAAQRKFIESFPQRSYSNITVHEMLPLGNGQARVAYSMNYRYLGKKEAAGRTDVMIVVVKRGGTWQITDFDEKVTRF
jgi:hypothetical protein